MSFSKIVFTPFSYTGWGSLDQLIPEVEKIAPKNILVVTDPALVKLGLSKRVTEPLTNKGYNVFVYEEISPEPPLDVAVKLVNFTREGQFDLVIGLGGGSALDLAKLTAVLSVHRGHVSHYLNLSGCRVIEKRGLPKILIPTTSGTGSEVTNIAVLSLETTKDVVAHDYLLADVAIVDPELTLTLPPKVTAATGIDALTHAVEAFISVKASPTTDALALHAIRLIGRSLRVAVANGENKEARSDMSYGSYLAGLAFLNAGVAGVHALAYPIGGQFHISHGESNAVLLPYVMGYIRKSCQKRMAHIYEALGFDRGLLNDEEASSKCVDALQKLVNDVGISSSLKDFDIPETAIEQLTVEAIKQQRILERSPMPLYEADIRKIYQSAFDGMISEKP